MCTMKNKFYFIFILISVFSLVFGCKQETDDKSLNSDDNDNYQPPYNLPEIKDLTLDFYTGSKKENPSFSWNVIDADFIKVLADDEAYYKTYELFSGEKKIDIFNKTGIHSLTLIAMNETGSVNKTIYYYCDNREEPYAEPPEICEFDYDYHSKQVLCWKLKRTQKVQIFIEDKQVFEGLDGYDEKPVRKLIQELGKYLTGVHVKIVASNFTGSVQKTILYFPDDDFVEFPRILSFYPDNYSGYEGEPAKIYWQLEYVFSCDIYIDNKLVLDYRPTASGNICEDSRTFAALSVPGLHIVEIIAHNQIDDVSQSFAYRCIKKED